MFNCYHLCIADRMTVKPVPRVPSRFTNLRDEGRVDMLKLDVHRYRLVIHLSYLVHRMPYITYVGLYDYVLYY